MKLIQQSADIWGQPKTEIDVYKLVERAARLCYKSEDKITDDSYKRFIDMISSKGHLSPFEHGTVYLAITDKDPIAYRCAVDAYLENPYSKVILGAQGSTSTAFVTTNYRVLKENQWEKDLQYLCAPTEYHIKRISVHITTSIGISRELNRHRCHSICEESSRYCNYSKDKFGNELTFIIPDWVNTHCPNEENKGPKVADLEWSEAMMNAEASYFLLLGEGWKPQQARSVLPLDTKTELIHTAFEDDWEQFFKLRCSSAAHPMMQELANEIRDKIRIYKENNYDN
jgi:thymidylate synthase (FAD)